MKLFDGLYSYEIVLLILGVVLFAAVLVAFLRKLFTTQKYGDLLPYFGMSVIMIGFSGLQSFKIAGIEADLADKAQAVQQNPSDSAAREQLQKDANALSSRPVDDPQVNTKLAEAQFALGNESAAKAHLQKALQADPNLTAAQDVKRKIELSDRLTALVSQVNSAPANDAAKAQLSQTVGELSHTRVANPNTMAQLAQAYAVLGKPQEAQRHVDAAASINPNLPAVRAAQIKIRAMPVALPPEHH